MDYITKHSSSRPGYGVPSFCDLSSNCTISHDLHDEHNICSAAGARDVKYGRPSGCEGRMAAVRLQSSMGAGGIFWDYPAPPAVDHPISWRGWEQAPPVSGTVCIADGIRPKIVSRYARCGQMSQVDQVPCIWLQPPFHGLFFLRLQFVPQAQWHPEHP